MARDGGMNDLLRRAQKMQRDLAKLQRELKERIVEGAAEDRTVVVQANGAQELVALRLSPRARELATDELEDLLLAAANQALKKARELAQEESAKITGNAQLGLPGLLG